MMEPREIQFHKLKEYFDKKDMEFIQQKGTSVFHTEYGLYGSSNLYDVFELFKQIEMQGTFLDLGSGDGRITLLASLFTNAVGIEGDPTLHKKAEEAHAHLQEGLPNRCSFLQEDYTEHDLSQYDVLFIYADHDWPDWFQEKLLKECTGTLYSLHNIYKPSKLKKGKTFWIGQVPFVSYVLGDASSSE